MSTSRFPLPADDELTPAALETLDALMPLNLFRAVAALPAALSPFVELSRILLLGQELTAVERETAILRVAHVTKAGYERHQHEQLARGLGMTEAQLSAISADPVDLGADGNLICRATDEITRDVRLGDDTLAAVRGRWGDAGATELILVVSFYNMVSRFLESARVPIEAENVVGNRAPGDLGRSG